MEGEIKKNGFSKGLVVNQEGVGRLVGQSFHGNELKVVGSST